MQKVIPNKTIPRTSLLFFSNAPKKIIIYPTNPINATGIPKNVRIGPLITASQLTTAFIEQGLNAG